MASSRKAQKIELHSREVGGDKRNFAEEIRAAKMIVESALSDHSADRNVLQGAVDALQKAIDDFNTDPEQFNAEAAELVGDATSFVIQAEGLLASTRPEKQKKPGRKGRKERLVGLAALEGVKVDKKGDESVRTESLESAEDVKKQLIENDDVWTEHIGPAIRTDAINHLLSGGIDRQFVLGQIRPEHRGSVGAMLDRLLQMHQQPSGAESGASPSVFAEPVAEAAPKAAMEKDREVIEQEMETVSEKMVEMYNSLVQNEKYWHDSADQQEVIEALEEMTKSGVIDEETLTSFDPKHHKTVRPMLEQLLALHQSYSALEAEKTSLREKEVETEGAQEEAQKFAKQLLTDTTAARIRDAVPDEADKANEMLLPEAQEFEQSETERIEAQTNLVREAVAAFREQNALAREKLIAAQSQEHLPEARGAMKTLRDMAITLEMVEDQIDDDHPNRAQLMSSLERARNDHERTREIAATIRGFDFTSKETESPAVPDEAAVERAKAVERQETQKNKVLSALEKLSNLSAEARRLAAAVTDEETGRELKKAMERIRKARTKLRAEVAKLDADHPEHDMLIERSEKVLADSERPRVMAAEARARLDRGSSAETPDIPNATESPEAVEAKKNVEKQILQIEECFDNLERACRAVNLQLDQRLPANLGLVQDFLDDVIEQKNEVKLALDHLSTTDAKDIAWLTGHAETLKARYRDAIERIKNLNVRIEAAAAAAAAAVVRNELSAKMALENAEKEREEAKRPKTEQEAQEKIEAEFAAFSKLLGKLGDEEQAVRARLQSGEFGKTAALNFLIKETVSKVRDLREAAKYKSLLSDEEAANVQRKVDLIRTRFEKLKGKIEELRVLEHESYVRPLREAVKVDLAKLTDALDKLAEREDAQREAMRRDNKRFNRKTVNVAHENAVATARFLNQSLEKLRAADPEAADAFVDRANELRERLLELSQKVSMAVESEVLPEQRKTKPDLEEAGVDPDEVTAATPPPPAPFVAQEILTPDRPEPKPSLVERVGSTVRGALDHIWNGWGEVRKRSFDVVDNAADLVGSEITGSLTALERGDKETTWESEKMRAVATVLADVLVSRHTRTAEIVDALKYLPQELFTQNEFRWIKQEVTRIIKQERSMYEGMTPEESRAKNMAQTIADSEFMTKQEKEELLEELKKLDQEYHAKDFDSREHLQKDVAETIAWFLKSRMRRRDEQRVKETKSRGKYV